MSKENLKLMFNTAVLVKTIYYPAFVQDSIEKKPINRNYFLVSVYDEDTNKDTLLNKVDLRRFYCFTEDCSQKIQLIPPDYSVIRSQYDPMNDAMFVFARHDENKNGFAEAREPIQIFWFSLKTPAPAKRLYH
jgi:hypothetical protein